jgi:hypothetical protein
MKIVSKIEQPVKAVEGQVLPPLMPIANVIEQIKRDWNKGAEWQIKANDMRLIVGVRLLSLRRRIEAGEEGDCNWWQWYRDHFPKMFSEDYARKLMNDAKAVHPRIAVQMRRDYDAARSKGYRNRQQAKLSSSINRLTSDGSGNRDRLTSVDQSLPTASLGDR